jgi:hypothetical protein
MLLHGNFLIFGKSCVSVGLRLIEAIVKLVIKETNSKLKLCNMEYNKKEKKTGIQEVNY